ncbi:MAG: toprim domain-containing protein, partial [Candidatus Hydrogenedentes bacterium]|nr:toprim domain-containing protein [Candidatus Hydrogenedentota bacterium]
HRIIIPLYMNGVLMSYVGRDVTGRATIRYKAVPIDQCIRDPKSMIYHIDHAHDKLILVEGATDVWRIGKGCGASMGAALTPAQITQIIQKKFSRIFILYDNDATGVAEGEKIGALLSQYVDVEILYLPEGTQDPGELTSDDVKVLRKQVFGKIY